MYSIRKINKYETTWISNKDIENLYKNKPSAVTNFESWFTTMQESPHSQCFGLLKNKKILEGLGIIWKLPHYHTNSAHVFLLLKENKQENKQFIAFLKNNCKNCSNIEIRDFNNKQENKQEKK